MSQLDWQNSVALLMVAMASSYLAYRAIVVFVGRQKAGCGAACKQCPSARDSSQEPAGKPVTIISAQQLANTLPKTRVSQP